MWSEWHLRKNHPAAVVRMGALPVEAVPVEAVPAVARTVEAAPAAVARMGALPVEAVPAVARTVAAAPAVAQTVEAAPAAVHQAVPPTADLKLLRHRMTETMV